MPPYSSSDEYVDVEVTGYDGETRSERRKKKRSTKARGPIVGPLFETFDVGMVAGEYVDITPLEPLPKYGRIERGVLKRVLRAGVGGK